MTRIVSKQGFAVLALAAALAAGFAGWQTPVIGTVNAAGSEARASQSLPQFSAIYEAVAPAVVSVRSAREEMAEAKTPTPPQLPPGMGKDWEEFAKRFGPEGRPTPSRSMGSGFIISPDGYILTNAHVVANGGEIKITLSDEREFDAKIIGSDRRTDIALLKVDATGLPTAKLGDPAQTKVGDWVAAVGSPFGFEQTLTVGVVSAKSRSLPNEAYVPFIQTDAALNPGNSGGPLLNLNGEVVGVNSQIYSPTGGYAGLSFAIPIDVAVKIKDQLQQHGKVTRGRIGVVIQDVNKELAESFQLANSKGALVSSLDKTGPAHAAGIQAGDIITAVNGKTVGNAAEVSRSIGDLKPGESANIALWRNGAATELQVKLDELPSDQVAATSVPTEKPQKLGVVVRPLTEQEKEKLGETAGVMIESATGPAARAGLRQGDVILAFNQTKVNDVEELKRLVDAAGKRAALLVAREGSRRYISVTLG